MATENENGQERSEDPTEERRDEFRQKGEVTYSRELSGIASLIVCFLMLSYFTVESFQIMSELFIKSFDLAFISNVTEIDIVNYIKNGAVSYFWLFLPFGFGGVIAATLVTFLQTRFNISTDKISFNLSRLDPVQGVLRLVSTQTFFEVGKSTAKLLLMIFIAFLILYGEQAAIPNLLFLPFMGSASYLSRIEHELMWAIVGAMLLISVVDYIYQYFTIENKLKMTKQEVKEEYKQRETDPIVKGRIRRMQRDIANRKTMLATKKATVILTNPTHYSVAILYELGMAAPLVIAKGQDYIALRMREVAKENNIPIVENKPLARALFDTVAVNKEVPEKFYKAVSEIIRYVFRIKGIMISKSKKTDKK